MAGKGSEQEPQTYASTGVNYEAMDPFKRLAQLKARETSSNLRRFGMFEIEASRGESAYVWREGDSYRAFVIEGLGTKNLVADEMRKITGKTYYDQIAQDTVAMIVNDLIVVGADPQVVNAYFAVGDSDWFSDEERSKDLVEGWQRACNLAGAVWGGGETPTLKGIISPDTIDLSGSAIGLIEPKERLTLGEKIVPGDAILLIESSGIHANGLTLARTIAEKLPDGYATELSDGIMYGEALLTPTHIYRKLISYLFHEKIDIHYMVNITGHGWRKLMRAARDFAYVINRVPTPQPIFEFIQQQSGNDDSEMYGNFNMGAGFAIFLPQKDVDTAIEIVRDNHFMDTLNAGVVQEGPRQVIIQPKNLVFSGETLDVR
ncbi:MAG: phosphoribosylformylglycinamidine cyclo-ligase [Candidatus Levybacteria bacterium RIFCSPLOWO2_02_FULL_37_10]|nr:MAG: phosphoribosylformylglycinamidine cyclo-ligase [Candidatus Levybacteria bacterium RIFCSPHIGHO2_01_FULL_37_33]OGH15618.1 MAG: phosphoribosylformylglycinamidine cyclo-ligase [Candidatus Levybacteria bacterium RIFCSPHIGHO2_02_FULL_37_11]OGH30126.1 MAG: phosphoribosylformylglycinamidine cyclo-ligase [Candidatus Levybacteria bacterium RIFCSPHIGHO2_12_FULL_37_12]OGH32379.1 MAG: phosphoribosylformylglycinamidine cyclo-ligase [Candidatus Levybacteria bacterium RIFCSPLOWO2_01_FULL_36_54]OGH46300